MFNLLEGSSYTSLSNRQTNFIAKEIDALESRRSQYTKKMRDIQNSKSAIFHLKEQLTNQQRELQESSTLIKNAKIKLQKYKLKKVDLQNKRIVEIIVYQQLQLQLQSLKKQLLEIFTPKSNKQQILRLKLIEIESNSQIVKFSQQFSIRKIVLLFLKKNKIEIRDIQNLQLQIAKRNKIDQFKYFIEDYINSKKLNEFKKLFKQSIQKYIKTLEQIKQLGFSQEIKSNIDQESEQSKRQNLILDWKNKKHDLMIKKNQIDTIFYKIEQNNKKIKKYEQQVKESISRQNQFQNKLNYYSQIKVLQKQDQKILMKMKIELRQLNEAVNYLKNKRDQQNSNFLNSPKSMGFIDTLQHSKISKTLALQNCELSNSNVITRSSKYSDTSLFKSPKNKVKKDKQSSKLKKSNSPIFR